MSKKDDGKPTATAGDNTDAAGPEKSIATAAELREGLNAKSKNQIVEALCRELKIDPQYVFASSVDEKSETVTVLTNGGTRIRLRPGDDLPKLTEVQITGISPKKPRVLAGKTKAKKE